MAGSFSSGFSTGFVTSTPGSFSSGFSSGFAVSTSGTTWTGAATIAGAGSVAATARLRALAQTTIAGAGGVTATARLSAAAKTTLAGVGGVAATGRLSAVASATLAGAGGVVVNTAILPPSRATLAGAGGITVTANVVNIGLSRATIDGAGGVTVNTFTVPASRVTIAGTGGVTVTGARVIAKATATLVGAGAMTVAPHIDSPPFVIEPPVPPSQQQVSPPSPIDNYLELIPAYNRVQPNFIGTLSAVLQPLVDLQALLLDMPRQFDLDYAIGVQLDQVGLWIGRDRFVQVPISNVFFSWDIDGLGWEQGTWQGTFDPDEGISKLDDETYRVLLYAKAAANSWDGSFEEMVVILNTLLQGRSLTTVIHDNQDMSLEVIITGILNDLVLTAILQGGYLPIKPEGVKITYTLPQSTLPAQPQVLGGVASLHGTGGVSVTGAVRRVATVSIAGTGAVSTNNIITIGPTGQQFTATARIAGTGSVTATARTRLRATATLAGAGGIVVNATTVNTHLAFSDEFTSLSLRNTRNLPAGGTWQPARWYSPDDDGYAVNSGWMVNPFNPATPITTLYTQSGSNLVLGLDNTPGAYAAACGGEPFVSSQLHTASTFRQTTGYWECRAAVPNVPGTGFAFWLMTDIQWPPEIDITETVILQDGSQFAVQTLWNADPNAPAVVGTNYSYDMASPPDTTQMHTYGCEVTATTVTFFIDRIQTGSYAKPAGYTNPMFMLLSYETGDPSWEGNPDGANMPSFTQVDYVKAWTVRPF